MKRVLLFCTLALVTGASFSQVQWNIARFKLGTEGCYIELRAIIDSGHYIHPAENCGMNVWKDNGRSLSISFFLESDSLINDPNWVLVKAWGPKEKGKTKISHNRSKNIQTWQETVKRKGRPDTSITKRELEKVYSTDCRIYNWVRYKAGFEIRKTPFVSQLMREEESTRHWKKRQRKEWRAYKQMRPPRPRFLRVVIAYQLDGGSVKTELLRAQFPPPPVVKK